MERTENFFHGRLETRKGLQHPESLFQLASHRTDRGDAREERRATRERVVPASGSTMQSANHPAIQPVGQPRSRESQRRVRRPTERPTERQSSVGARRGTTCTLASSILLVVDRRSCSRPRRRFVLRYIRNVETHPRELFRRTVCHLKKISLSLLFLFLSLSLSLSLSLAISLSLSFLLSLSLSLFS